MGMSQGTIRNANSLQIEEITQVIKDLEEEYPVDVIGIIISFLSPKKCKRVKAVNISDIRD